jgi:hypothetical protein
MFMVEDKSLLLDAECFRTNIGVNVDRLSTFIKKQVLVPHIDAIHGVAEPGKDGLNDDDAELYEAMCTLFDNPAKLRELEQKANNIMIGGNTSDSTKRIAWEPIRQPKIEQQRDNPYVSNLPGNNPGLSSLGIGGNNPSLIPSGSNNPSLSSLGIGSNNPSLSSLGIGGQNNLTSLGQGSSPFNTQTSSGSSFNTQSSLSGTQQSPFGGSFSTQQSPFGGSFSTQQYSGQDTSQNNYLQSRQQNIYQQNSQFGQQNNDSLLSQLMGGQNRQVNQSMIQPVEYMNPYNSLFKYLNWANKSKIFNYTGVIQFHTLFPSPRELLFEAHKRDQQMAFNEYRKMLPQADLRLILDNDGYAAQAMALERQELLRDIRSMEEILSYKSDNRIESYSITQLSAYAKLLERDLDKHSTTDTLDNLCIAASASANKFADGTYDLPIVGKNLNLSGIHTRITNLTGKAMWRYNSKRFAESTGVKIPPVASLIISVGTEIIDTMISNSGNKKENVGDILDESI